MLSSLHAKARAVVENFTARGEIIALAESCTGGLLSSLITAIPGASAVLDRALVTYANQAKIDLLGVSPDILMAQGAVSAECASAMVAGLLASCPAAAAAVAVTGIAGPTGGKPQTANRPAKPVGLVFIAAQRRGQPAKVEMHHFGGDRQAIQHLAADACLNELLSLAA